MKMKKNQENPKEKEAKKSKTEKQMKKKQDEYSSLRNAEDISEVMQLIKDKHGNESILIMNGAPNCNVEVISTGSLKVDAALGIGGLPRGRIIEMFGPEAGGKTTAALSVVATAQKISKQRDDGKKAGFIDAECALNQSLVTKTNVDPENLILVQPDYGEQALDIATMLIESGRLSVLVIDSVSALIPKKELFGEMDDSNMGEQARMMGKAMRKIAGAVKRSGTMVIFINQLRQKIGVMFGSDETTTGGKALPFFASVRLRIGTIGKIKQNNEIIGNKTKVLVVKNKLAPPLKEVVTDLLYTHGFNKEGELIDLGVDAGILEKNGSWVSYGDDKIGNGRLAACEFLKQNPEIANQIELDVTGHFDNVSNYCNEDNIEKLEDTEELS